MNGPVPVFGMAFWKRALALGGLATALAAGVLQLAKGPDGTLAASYGRALADVETSWQPAPTENVWLSRMDNQRAMLPRALALGDRISYGRGERIEEIEVTGLEHIDGESFGLSGLKIQIVTGRPKGAGPGDKVRFLFAVDGAETTSVAPLPDRAL